VQSLLKQTRPIYRTVKKSKNNWVFKLSFLELIYFCMVQSRLLNKADFWTWCHGKRTIFSKTKPFIILAALRKRHIRSFWCTSPRHSAKATQLHARCWSGGEPFATLCKIWPAFGIRTLDLPHTRHVRKKQNSYNKFIKLINKKQHIAILAKLFSIYWSARGNPPANSLSLRLGIPRCFSRLLLQLCQVLF